ncbi:unnamed protein product [Bemisia tabaci]|uniref:Protein-tyrosine-phosphatase n=1 Tax=Bemisia tabaci TaxID=7038 RepID=A0A9P0AKJ8_BEMTA|nr:unnamed protein product [Bemisia tabaci]
MTSQVKHYHNNGLINALERLDEDLDAGPTNFNKIEEGLFLARKKRLGTILCNPRNLTAAKDVHTLVSNAISHILTVDSCPLPKTITDLKEIKNKFMQVTDIPQEDLLSYFSTSYDFIKEGQEKGNVLVHCYYGVSRSASVVIAYLMKKHQISFDESFKRVKSCRRFASPNKGFEAQLKLYEVMNFTIDKTNLQYRMFRLRHAAVKVRKVKILPQDCMDVIKPDPSLTSVKPDPLVYKCRKCRRIVASISNILPHSPSEKPSWKNVKWSGDLSNVDQCSQIHFIEPLNWIENVSHAEEGKINCPKCKSKLGSFSWIMGCKCPCGAEVTPAFYLVPSKVEFSNFVQNVQITV